MHNEYKNYTCFIIAAIEYHVLNGKIFLETTHPAYAYIAAVVLPGRMYSRYSNILYRYDLSL